MLSILLAFTLINAGAESSLHCAKDPRVIDAIASLGKQSDYRDSFSALANDPALSACHLIQSLHVVPETNVPGYEQFKLPHTMGVIWAIRALRYLTDCQDFRATTAENTKGWDDARRDFLLRNGVGEPLNFFATWMSRDSVFIAPRDAQEKIIAHWVQWYKDTGSRGFHFHTCESVDRWYF